MFAVLYTVAFLLTGYVLIRTVLPKTPMFYRIWLGGALGIFLMMWLPYLAGLLLDFTILAHMAALGAAAAAVIVCSVLRNKSVPVSWTREDTGILKCLAWVTVPLLLLSVYLEYTHNLRPAADGSLHVGQSTYGDLNLHLSIITSMRNASLPADYSIYPGELLSYPFLTDSLSTSMMLLGMDLRGAVLFPSSLLLLLTYAGYYLLAQRVLNKKGTVLLATLFFFLNGGLGFLYAFDMTGVSLGSSGYNELQSGTGLISRIGNILNGWYQAPANHAEFTMYNLRWSNVICDMLIPQRTTLGGWCQVLPCLYLLYDAFCPASQQVPQTEENIYAKTFLLGIWAGGLVMIHTHSFLALGLISAGWLIYDFLHPERTAPHSLLRWISYGALALLIALPQLFTWTFHQVEGSSHFLSFHFNWVNNSGNNGLRDGYLWFYIKNIGLPFVLLLLSLLEKNSRRRHIASGIFVLFLAAEFFQFQPNEYDNNKLFYVWYMFGAMLAADFAMELFAALKAVRARYVMAVIGCVLCFSSALLSLARETVSDYMLFSAEETHAAEYIENNTPEHAVFVTWNEHINPVSSLAGRQIICGPDLWLYYHGFSTGARQQELREFYAEPREHLDLLDKYGADWIWIGSWERSGLTVNLNQMETLFDRVYESSDGSIRIYRRNLDE